VVAFDQLGNARRRIKSASIAAINHAARGVCRGNGVSEIQLHLYKLVQNNQILCKGKVVFKKLRCVITLGLKSAQRPLNIKSLFLSVCECGARRC